MIWKDVKISTQLRIGFAVIMVFVILMGVLSVYQSNSMYNQTIDMYNHPLRVRRAIGEFKSLVMTIHRDMKDIVYVSDPALQEEMITAIKHSESEAYQQLAIIKDYYLGPEADVDSLQQAMMVWSGIRERTIQLVTDGKQEEAILRTRRLGVGGAQVDRILALESRISKFAQNKADALYKNATRHRDSLFRYMILSIFVVLFFCLWISFYLIKLVNSPLKELLLASDKYQAGQYDTRIKYKSENEIGQLAKSLNSLASSLQNELNLYQQVASLSATMLKEEELHQFCIKILRAIMQLSNSQTGVVYLLNKDTLTLSPFESLGIKKDKLQDLHFQNLEGEIALALVNGEIQQIKSLPEDSVYNFLTSIGEVKARELITIPLKNSNGIIAVISISSVYEYKADAIRIIKDILNTMATRLNGVLLMSEMTILANRLEVQNAELEAQKRSLSSQASELAEQNAELEMQKKELNQANQLKTTFLSNMSHELRTPLNSIIALSGVLGRRLEEKLSSEEFSYLDVIERNGKQLLSLINDILDLSRIESGKVEIDFEHFSPNALIQELYDEIHAQAVEKGIELLLDLAPELPQVISDSKKCRHILQNLIGNAIKFTLEGSVRICTSQEKDYIKIDVIDTGIGMSQTQLKVIFDEFRQADGSTSRRFGGSGLGLSIAKKYAEMLGGAITVQSEEGKGSTFSYFLPIGDGKFLNEEELLKESAEEPTAKFTSDGAATIMIVEDSIPAIIQLEDILQVHGYNTLVAKNGKEALDLLATTIPDAMILDLMMPEVDGFEVLKHLRLNDLTKDLPVLVLTAKQVSKEELSVLKGNRIWQLILKGDVNKHELLGIIQRMLGQGSQTPVEMEPTLPRVSSAKNETSKLRAKLPYGTIPRVLVVEDNADNMLTIKALLWENFYVIEATDGKSGVEMAKQHIPDLILMDIALPVMNGLQALDAIRKIDGLQHIPIIAVTASVMKGNREETLNFGFDGFIAKPIDHQVFFEVIEGIIYGTH